MVAITGKAVFIANTKFPADYKAAIKKGLEMAGLAYEIEVKKMITNEEHVVTGRLRSSINKNVSDGIPRNYVPESLQDDGHHEFRNSDMTLEVGTNVPYAVWMEKRYNILSRSGDTAKNAMATQFELSLKKFLSTK